MQLPYVLQTNPIITVPGNLLTPRKNPIISLHTISRALFSSPIIRPLSLLFLLLLASSAPARACGARATCVTRVAWLEREKKKKKKKKKERGEKKEKKERTDLTSVTALRAPPFRDCVCVASIRHKGEGQGEMILRQWRFSFQGFLALHVIACSTRGWEEKRWLYRGCSVSDRSF